MLKRLHPRRPGEHGEHYHGCMLHEIEENSRSRNSMSPTNRSLNSSRYSSLTSLNQHRYRPASSASNYSTSTLSRSPPPSAYHFTATSTPKRNSIGFYSTSSILSNSSMQDSDDSMTRFKSIFSDANDAGKIKSKSTICLNSSDGDSGVGSRGNSVEKRNGTVTFKMYDSPDEIIANLFPGINDKETTYLRKGHGAAQMAKYTNRPAIVNGARSYSALGNYASDNHKNRSYSTSSEASSNSKERTYYRSSAGSSRLGSVERDFENIR